jgi:hypothetical protein
MIVAEDVSWKKKVNKKKTPLLCVFTNKGFEMLLVKTLNSGNCGIIG